MLLQHLRVKGVNATIFDGIAWRPVTGHDGGQMVQRLLLPPGDMGDGVLEQVAAEPAVAPGRGGNTAFQSSAFHLPPRRVNGVDKRPPHAYGS